MSVRTVAALSMLLVASQGCVRRPEASGSGPGAASGPMAQAPAGPANARSEILGPFLAAYWTLPVPAQGQAPAGFAEAERSLDPAACGACHPNQYAEWSTSLHAGAYSPGLSGQLLEGSLSRPAAVRQCQTCHAPLSEQQPWNAAGEAAPRYDPALRQQGIVCASCHVRSHRRYGPPRRVDAPAAPEPPPHAGFEVRAEFQQSRFCAECHQFFDREGVAGKPVQNTFVEWRESAHAEAGRTCQSCHMPDRAHTWRGIHDPEMVRSGVDVALSEVAAAGGRITATLSLHNRGVGHAFPTYVTPRVFLTVWQVDGQGAAIEGTRAERVVGREIDFRSSTERFDTRVLPGESARLEYATPRDPAARAVVGRVTVDPGHHYRGVFRSLLESLEGDEARARIARALRLADASTYVLYEERRGLPPPRG